MLQSNDIEVFSIADFETVIGQTAPYVEETGTTFLENAILKAEAYAKWSGLPAIADDSGLCVDALAGAPGVISSRYAGLEGDDAANNRKLLNELTNVDSSKRGAYFHATVVYVDGSAISPIVAESQWHGAILREQKGKNGFGYDPLFWVPTHQCTSAELAVEIKNRISHRGQAVRSLLAQLSTYWRN